MMAKYAHLALQNHNILPDDFLAMPVRKRAFIVASDIVAAESLKNK